MLTPCLEKCYILDDRLLLNVIGGQKINFNDGVQIIINNKLPTKIYWKSRGTIFKSNCMVCFVLLFRKLCKSCFKRLLLLVWTTLEEQLSCPPLGHINSSESSHLQHKRPPTSAHTVKPRIKQR